MKVAVVQIQCPNPKCRRILVNPHETFCPECGTRLPQAVIPRPDSLSETAPPPLELEVAGRGSRAGGFLIDVLIAGILTPLVLAPVIGQYLVGLLWGLYFLFRDINGASLGKMILGLKVVSKDGRPATIRQKLLRNLLLVLPDLAEFLPFLGIFLGPGMFLVIVGLETIVF
jgi:uncharacterized RDD family membrane protein YckC